MKSKSLKKAQANYSKKCKRYSFDCYPSDGDIIAQLESKKSKGGNGSHNGYSTYIKDLIRKDMKK